MEGEAPWRTGAGTNLELSSILADVSAVVSSALAGLGARRLVLKASARNTVI